MDGTAVSRDSGRGVNPALAGMTCETRPRAGPDELPDMNDEAWRREVHDYYGVTYVFWDR